MTSSVKQLCTICHDGGVSKEAVTWCIECEVFFCGNCEKPHRMSRLSKNHKTISSKGYQELPSFVQEVSSQCSDHNKKFELYCSSHACPCCVQCITDNHKKCQQMKSLSDILKEVKSPASVQLFEKDMKDVKTKLDNAIQYLKTRISTTNIQKTKAIEEIRSMKKSIDDYLNKLELEILNDLESKHSKLKSNMTTLVQQMERRAQQIDRMQSEFIKLTQFATELQMYIGLKEIGKTTSQAAKYITDLESANHFNERNLDVNISSALTSILQDVKSFGEINIKITPSTLRLKAERKEQAQYLVPIFPGIEKIKPSLMKRLTITDNIKSLNIWACFVLPDGNFIMFDYNKNRLLLFSIEGLFMREVVSFSEIPLDACLVRDDTVAVALGSSNQTALVNIEQNKITKMIKLLQDCDAVASDGQTLVISGMVKSTKVNLNDMSHTILEGVRASRIAIFKENIYGTIYYENKVFCYTSTGEPLWTFQHHGINLPQGLTLDANGFVYIASRGNNNIVVVSPDGKTSKTILSEADGIKNPYAVDINRESGMMIVSIEIRKNSDSAVVYKI